jgi:hypothetical protein
MNNDNLTRPVLAAFVKRVRAGQVLELGLAYKQMAGSVVSYALRNDECPIEAVTRAKLYGHKVHYFTPMPSVLSDPPMPPESFIDVQVGDLIQLEGRLFWVDAPRPGSDTAVLTPLTAMERVKALELAYEILDDHDHASDHYRVTTFRAKAGTARASSRVAS